MMPRSPDSFAFTFPLMHRGASIAEIDAECTVAHFKGHTEYVLHVYAWVGGKHVPLPCRDGDDLYPLAMAALESGKWDVELDEATEAAINGAETYEREMARA